MKLAVAFAVALCLVSLCGAAHAEGRRLALLIGSNAGDAGEERLHHAENEARALGEILRSVGDFAPSDVIVLAHPTPREVEQAFETLRAATQDAHDETLLFVFYSGHADGEALHLAGQHFAVTGLRDAVAAVPSTARVLVVDACRSGAITRVKGGRPGPAFEVHLETPLGARGLAILTSSGAGEDAQESDELGSSLFTHFLTSALVGAGDRDGDGAVTIEEAFAYASERTVVATSSSQAGPQHPTFRYDLGGHGGLVITRPGLKHTRLGWVQFPEPGWYLVRRADGPIVAELHTTRGGQKLALASGHYTLHQRLPELYLEGPITVVEGTAAIVATDKLRRMSYPRGIRKGLDPAWFPSSGHALATPLSRKWWLWTALGAVAVGVSVGVGVGVTQAQRTEPTFNPVTFQR